MDCINDKRLLHSFSELELSQPYLPWESLPWNSGVGCARIRVVRRLCCCALCLHQTKGQVQASVVFLKAAKPESFGVRLGKELQSVRVFSIHSQSSETGLCKI